MRKKTIEDFDKGTTPAPDAPAVGAVSSLKVSTRLQNKVGKSSILGSRDVLDAVVVLLKQDIETDLKSMRKRDSLTSVNYTELLADHLATQRTYEKVIELILIKEGKSDHG